MTLEAIVAKARRHLNDEEGSIFKAVDVEDFINEGIDRFRSSIYFVNEAYLTTQEQEPVYIPQQYQHLLALFSASRLFAQDERHYQATTFMNEYEVKLEELLTKIESGEITITDSEGTAVTADYEEDYVTNEYFVYSEITDLDEGV